MKKAYRWDDYFERVRGLPREKIKAELERKIKTEQGLRAVRAAMLDGNSGWVDLLRKSPLHGHLKYFAGWREFEPLLPWIEKNRTGARDALRRLWADDNGTATTNASTEETFERIRVFADELPTKIRRPGGRMKVISVLLMALGAERHPPFGTRAFDKTYEKIGYGPLPRKRTEADLYKCALGFLDRLIKETEMRGLDLPTNRLEAQSVVWRVSLQWRQERNKKKQGPKRSLTRT